MDTSVEPRFLLFSQLRGDLSAEDFKDSLEQYGEVTRVKLELSHGYACFANLDALDRVHEAVHLRDWFVLTRFGMSVKSQKPLVGKRAYGAASSQLHGNTCSSRGQFAEGGEESQEALVAYSNLPEISEGHRYDRTELLQVRRVVGMGPQPFSTRAVIIQSCSGIEMLAPVHYFSARGPDISSGAMVPTRAISDVLARYPQLEDIKILLIAEKPALAQTLARSLSGKDRVPRRRRALRDKCVAFDFCGISGMPSTRGVKFTVMSMLGHIYNAGFDQSRCRLLQLHPEKMFEENVLDCYDDESSQSVIQLIADECVTADVVIAAPDGDREGKRIALEACAIAASRMSTRLAESDRVWHIQFSSLDNSTLRQAMLSMQKLNLDESEASLARQATDLIVGCAFSAVISDIMPEVIDRCPDLQLDVLLARSSSSTSSDAERDDGSYRVTYGTCQAPTLFLCVERANTVDNFEPAPFWEIEIECTAGDEHFQADSGRLFEASTATEQYVALLDLMNSQCVHCQRSSEPGDAVKSESSSGKPEARPGAWATKGSNLGDDDCFVDYEVEEKNPGTQDADDAFDCTTGSMLFESNELRSTVTADPGMVRTHMTRVSPAHCVVSDSDSATPSGAADCRVKIVRADASTSPIGENQAVATDSPVVISASRVLKGAPGDSVSAKLQEQKERQSETKHKMVKAEKAVGRLQADKHAARIHDTVRGQVPGLQRPLPLTTLRMLEAGCLYLNQQVAEVEREAQYLWEQGLITYPRTNSSKYPSDFDWSGPLRKLCSTRKSASIR
eukprot:TRINITY_DN18407_c0_g1_i1.p1 TRINITY_DN18407_c0_g1~~TRINITY_DN18407_c0_g1_i1.p1  ORF type:complete len:790 (+),score=114.01 TRINITY_DN18407_c0_g1_i1:51-2420(+)